MFFDAWTLLYFSVAFTVGILLLDLYLMIFNRDAHGRFLTLSRALVQLPWWVQTLVCAAICFLVWHFWG
jgi:hypothetical protein